VREKKFFRYRVTDNGRRSDLTSLRTDIIAWESAMSRKRRSDFFQADFFRRTLDGGDGEKNIESRAVRATDGKTSDNDRLVPRACGESHISDPSREQ